MFISLQRTPRRRSSDRRGPGIRTTRDTSETVLRHAEGPEVPSVSKYALLCIRESGGPASWCTTGPEKAGDTRGPAVPETRVSQRRGWRPRRAANAVTRLDQRLERLVPLHHEVSKGGHRLDAYNAVSSKHPTNITKGTVLTSSTLYSNMGSQSRFLIARIRAMTMAAPGAMSCRMRKFSTAPGRPYTRP